MVTRYTGAERERILRDSRRLLDELAAEADRRDECDVVIALEQDGLERPAWSARRSILDPATRSSEPMWKWRQEAEETARLQGEARQERLQRERDIICEQREAPRAGEDWNIWADRRIAAAREAKPFTKMQVDVIGGVIAEERKARRKELKAAIEALRTELAGEKAGGVVDQPALPLTFKTTINGPGAG